MSKEPEDYKLSEADHELRHQQLKNLLVDTKLASQNPTVIILAGQSGAGKSGLTDQAKSDFAPDARPVVVDIDELRETHPAYNDLKRINDRTAAGLVQADAGRWGDELITDAREGRRNIVIDGTLKSPGKAEALCQAFKDAGYRVEVRALAVRSEDSQLGVYRRYENAKASGRPGRWVPEKVHDEAYNGLSESLRLLNVGHTVDSIEIHGRSPDRAGGTRKLYSGAPGKGDPTKLLRAERSREREPEEIIWYESEMQKVKSQIKARDPYLREPENKVFIERSRQLEKMTSNKKYVELSKSGEMSSDEIAMQNTSETEVSKNKWHRSTDSVSKDRWRASKTKTDQEREIMPNRTERSDDGSPEHRWKPTKQKPPVREKLKED